MKSKVLAIYGSGGFGSDILMLAGQIVSCGQADWNEIVFIDDIADYSNRLEHRVMKYSEFKTTYLVGDTEIVIALGEPIYRRMIREKLSEDGYVLKTLIHPGTLVDGSCKIGSGVIIPVGTYIGCNTSISDNVAFIPANAAIGHDVSIGMDSVIGGVVSIGGHTNVGKETFVAANSALKNDINIGNQTIIGIGSCVVSNIGSEMVAVGNPAHIIKKNESQRVF